MGITTAWAITTHDDAFVAELAPRMLPLLAADRDDPVARERWRRWQRAPLPDHRTWCGGTLSTEQRDAVDSFLALTSSGGRLEEMWSGSGPDDDFGVASGVWEQSADPDDMFLSVQSKDFAVASLFHAIGPHRASLLPGWCGSFLLTSAEVTTFLPAVERALTFAPHERAAADEQDWLSYDDEESVLDGPLRAWRAAGAQGLGLCGVALTIY
ncbi:hypothetical protein G3I40_33320 [Streptomyces sp. SID14478]|uniref:hypothetical protein n=1 Tax=Streptomyces sp. SID14478 TaxID=2706073 RepID=UPI0013DCC3AF|nr:hypothetical protein [Streptomyces sp. SID14478]NEB80055.1 hypothetical protein [Streptomyces sp. SID14478]